MKALALLDSLCAALSRVLLALGGLFLVAMIALACANMFMRGALHTPIRGTYEMMGFLGALVCALALAPTQLRGGHIALTMFQGMLPRRAERLVDAFSHLACGLFFLLAAWRTALFGFSLIEFGELSEDLHIIYHPFVFAVALGCATLALTLARDLLHALAGTRPRP
jgi:TRAP-type C4-dicarboxylate transport system permease small subunit